ncbi:MAG: hypothetical protein AMJ69_06760 [Gammaproteobacteria bacterium SG8_47]|nr:MAG: hypothetical protein AMJ69_06760 [Gammaproteobacteria bacterium SG8_47]
MSDSLLSVLPSLALVLGAIAVSSCVWVMIWVRRALRAAQKEIEGLQRELRAFELAAVGVGDQVGKLAQRQRQLAAHQEQQTYQDPNSQPYQHAIRLAHRGASTEELMQVCGLNRGEAELLSLVHHLKKAG